MTRWIYTARGESAPAVLRVMRCPERRFRFPEIEGGAVRCPDLDEDSPLQNELSVGSFTI